MVSTVIEEKLSAERVKIRKDLFEMLNKAHRTKESQDVIVTDAKKESVVRRYVENGDERNG